MSTIVGTNIEVTNIKFDSDTTAMIVSNTGQITAQGEGTATTNLQQGLAKYWIDYNKYSNNNVEDSLNSSSITDAGTGNTTVNFANPIKNDAGTESSNYAAVLGQDGTAVNSTHCMQFIHGVPTSTQLPLIFFILTNSNARGDSGICCCAVFC